MKSKRRIEALLIIVLLLFNGTACKRTNSSRNSSNNNRTGSGSNSGYNSSAVQSSTISKFEIISRSTVYGGKSFAAVGQYELILARAVGVLDPADPRNSGIVNLNKAPKNADGMVNYTVDAQILKPLDMTKSNKKILYDVVNRGSRMALTYINSQTGWTSAGSGSDFLQNSGFTMVWSGWQGDISMPDIPSLTGAVGASFPIAVNSDGSAITGASREEFVDQTANPFVGTLTYPAATGAKANATLTVRQKETDPRIPVPQENWDYVAGSNNQAIQVTKVAGYDVGAIYEFIYTAKSPIVMGIGFAAVRDLVSFLRYNKNVDNPLKDTAVSKAILFGVSQSGRFVRDFIYQDFNLDASGRVVFEGAMPVIAGARRTFTNDVFAQPDRFTRQHEDHLYPMDSFPFAYNILVDRFSGKADGILNKCSLNNSCPNIFHVDSDSEVWQGHNSLIVTDTQGNAITPPDNVRVFLLAGRCHTPGFSANGIQAANSLSFSAPLRALLSSLDNWISDGIAPVASKWPTLADGSYVTMETAALQWPAGIPNWPWLNLINAIEPRDYSAQPPAITSVAFPLYVPRFNTDGNSVDGLIYPEVSVPVGTYSGRSTRKTGFAPGELNTISGAYRQFELTVAARALSGDPRPSLEELYPGADASARNANYQAKLKMKADELVAQRYMLPADAAAYYIKTLPTGVPAL
jgi:hypothetical protein